MSKVKKWAGKNATVIFLIIIFVALSFATKSFFSAVNLINVSSQMAINAFLATGITFVIITGGIDISMGSVAAFAGIASTVIGMQFPEMSVVGGLAIQLGTALVIGVVCGLFVGMLITKFEVVPMIATLAMMSIARGLAYVVTGGLPVFGLSNNFAWLGSGRIIKTETMPLGWIPILTIFMVIVVVIMHIVLNKTVFGRHVYAVGSNPSVAHLSGVNVKRIKIKVHTICCVLSSIGGVAVASKLNTGQPAACDGYEMFAIASTVLGGTSLAGGKGSVGRAMIGAAIIAIINNGMNLLQIDSYWQKIITGVIILFAVILDTAQNKKKN